MDVEAVGSNDRFMSRPRRGGAPGSSRDARSELHLRRLLDGFALVAEIEEGPRREAEHAREQRRRELLDAGVVLADRIVEEPARRRDLVLDVGQLGLQLLEI